MANRADGSPKVYALNQKGREALARMMASGKGQSLLQEATSITLKQRSFNTKTFPRLCQELEKPETQRNKQPFIDAIQQFPDLFHEILSKQISDDAGLPVIEQWLDMYDSLGIDLLAKRDNVTSRLPIMTLIDQIVDSGKPLDKTLDVLMARVKTGHDQGRYNDFFVTDILMYMLGKNLDGPFSKAIEEYPDLERVDMYIKALEVGKQDIADTLKNKLRPRSMSKVILNSSNEMSLNVVCFLVNNDKVEELSSLLETFKGQVDLDHRFNLSGELLSPLEIAFIQRKSKFFKLFIQHGASPVRAKALALNENNLNTTVDNYLQASLEDGQPLYFKKMADDFLSPKGISSRSSIKRVRRIMKTDVAQKIELILREAEPPAGDDECPSVVRQVADRSSTALSVILTSEKEPMTFSLASGVTLEGAEAVLKTFSKSEIFQFIRFEREPAYREQVLQAGLWTAEQTERFQQFYQVTHGFVPVLSTGDLFVNLVAAGNYKAVEALLPLMQEVDVLTESSGTKGLALLILDKKQDLIESIYDKFPNVKKLMAGETEKAGAVKETGIKLPPISQKQEKAIKILQLNVKHRLYKQGVERVKKLAEDVTQALQITEGLAEFGEKNPQFFSDLLTFQKNDEYLPLIKQVVEFYKKSHNINILLKGLDNKCPLGYNLGYDAGQYGLHPNNVETVAYFLDSLAHHGRDYPRNRQAIVTLVNGVFKKVVDNKHEHLAPVFLGRFPMIKGEEYYTFTIFKGYEGVAKALLPYVKANDILAPKVVWEKGWVCSAILLLAVQNKTELLEKNLKDCRGQIDFSMPFLYPNPEGDLKRMTVLEAAKAYESTEAVALIEREIVLVGERPPLARIKHYTEVIFDDHTLYVQGCPRGKTVRLNTTAIDSIRKVEDHRKDPKLSEALYSSEDLTLEKLKLLHEQMLALRDTDIFIDTNLNPEGYPIAKVIKNPHCPIDALMYAAKKTIGFQVNAEKKAQCKLFILVKLVELDKEEQLKAFLNEYQDFDMRSAVVLAAKKNHLNCLGHILDKWDDALTFEDFNGQALSVLNTYVEYVIKANRVKAVTNIRAYLLTKESLKIIRRDLNRDPYFDTFLELNRRVDACINKQEKLKAKAKKAGKKKSKGKSKASASTRKKKEVVLKPLPKTATGLVKGMHAKIKSRESKQKKMDYFINIELQNPDFLSWITSEQNRDTSYKSIVEVLGFYKEVAKRNLAATVLQGSTKIAITEMIKVKTFNPHTFKLLLEDFKDGIENSGVDPVYILVFFGQALQNKRDKYASMIFMTFPELSSKVQSVRLEPSSDDRDLLSAINMAVYFERQELVLEMHEKGVPLLTIEDFISIASTKEDYNMKEGFVSYITNLTESKNLVVLKALKLLLFNPESKLIVAQDYLNALWRKVQEGMRQIKAEGEKRVIEQAEHLASQVLVQAQEEFAEEQKPGLMTVVQQLTRALIAKDELDRRYNQRAQENAVKIQSFYRGYKVRQKREHFTLLYYANLKAQNESQGQLIRRMRIQAIFQRISRRLELRNQRLNQQFSTLQASAGRMGRESLQAKAKDAELEALKAKLEALQEEKEKEVRELKQAAQQQATALQLAIQKAQVQLTTTLEALQTKLDEEIETRTALEKQVSEDGQRLSSELEAAQNEVKTLKRDLEASRQANEGVEALKSRHQALIAKFDKIKQHITELNLPGLLVLANQVNNLFYAVLRACNPDLPIMTFEDGVGYVPQEVPDLLGSTETLYTVLDAAAKKDGDLMSELYQ